MSRIQFLAVVAVLTLGYVAANALDAALADVPRLMRVIDTASFILHIPVLIAVVLLFFGGLPLALFGLLIDQQGSGVLTEWQRSLRVPYAVLMFQIVSMGLSVFGLVMGGILLAYFGVQIVASVAAIPVWRRRLA